MADQNAELWPIAKFHFLVEIGGEQMSFQEVSGLDQETEVIEYRHGDDVAFRKIKMPGLTKVSNVTFKKGVFSADGRLLDLFNKIYDKEYYHENRLDVIIQLLDESGDPVMVWTLDRAFPTKLSGTDLKSDGNEVAIETLELAHEGLTLELG